MAGRQFKLGQVIGMALVAGAAASAQAAPFNSQGPAHASATGIANANANSVLAGGTSSKDNGNGNGNGQNTASTASGNGNSASNNGAAAGNGSSSASAGSASSSVSTTPAGNGNGNGNGASASSNAGNSGNSGNSGTASSGAQGSVPAGPTVVTAPPEPAAGISYSVDAMTVAASSYDFYRGFEGNDSKGIDNLDPRLGSGWLLAAKDNTDSGDDVANLVDGMLFRVNAGAQAASGQWTLTGTGGALGTGSILLDVVAVLKSSNQFGVYYFENVAFDGSGGGDWFSPRHDLSHLSIYVRAGSGGGVSQPDGGTSGGLGGGAGATPVPEPGSLALASLGLVALGLSRRKAARRG